MERMIQSILAQHSIKGYVSGDLVKHWETTQDLLNKANFNSWRSFLLSEGFEVNLSLSCETIPVLRACLRRKGYTITIEFGYGDGWEIAASIDLADLFKAGADGFQFRFDQGYSGRAIHGGGVWLSRGEFLSPLPYEPQQQIIRDKTRQLSEQTEALLKKLTLPG